MRNVAGRSSRTRALPWCAGGDGGLVESHLGLVHQAATTMAARVPRHVSRDDLLAAGMLGLTEAAKVYDPARGVPFECFAMARVRGALLDELRRSDWASRSVRARARAVAAAREVLAGRLGRHPTAAEVAAEVGLAEHEVARVGEDLRRAAVVHYEALVSAEGPCDDVLPASADRPEDRLLEREASDELHAAVASLPERLRLVVEGSYLRERRLRDIAADLGVTESRVSQLRTEALALLRSRMGASPDLDLRDRPGRRAGTLLPAAAVGA